VDNTSGLVFAGELGLPTFNPTANTESWNGTSWTEVNDLNTARRFLQGAGIQTSALGFGGTPAITGATESWNGTSWFEVNDLNSARSDLAGAGIQTSALAFGGDTPGVTAATESWNGSIWTETNDLNTGRKELGGTGTQTAALAFGGSTPSATAATEEWNANISVGAWVTGGNLNTARRQLNSWLLVELNSFIFSYLVEMMVAATSVAN
jgi:hypothetical protein